MVGRGQCGRARQATVDSRDRARATRPNGARRLGGARIALVSVVVEAAGLTLVWLAPSASVAFVGAAPTGLGYTLVYPTFGVEALRRAPPESRALTTGVFTAFLDATMGLANPLLGFLAGAAGVRSVFVVAAGFALAAASHRHASRPQLGVDG